MKIELIEHEDKAIFDALVAGVREHRIEQIGPKEIKPLSIVAKDDSGKLLGGVSGRIFCHHYLIEVLWVDKNSRGEGLGKQLMEIAETEAIKRGCVAAQVDTLSFQAPNFYKKLGFEEVGKVTGFKEHPDRYFLLKKY